MTEIIGDSRSKSLFDPDLADKVNLEKVVQKEPQQNVESPATTNFEFTRSYTVKPVYDFMPDAKTLYCFDEWKARLAFSGFVMASLASVYWAKNLPELGESLRRNRWGLYVDTTVRKQLTNPTPIDQYAEVIHRHGNSSLVIDRILVPHSTAPIDNSIKTISHPFFKALFCDNNNKFQDLIDRLRSLNPDGVYHDTVNPSQPYDLCHRASISSFAGLLQITLANSGHAASSCLCIDRRELDVR